MILQYLITDHPSKGQSFNCHILKYLCKETRPITDSCYPCNISSSQGNGFEKCSVVTEMWAQNVRPDVLMAVTKNTALYWQMTACRLL